MVVGHRRRCRRRIVARSQRVLDVDVRLEELAQQARREGAARERKREKEAVLVLFDGKVRRRKARTVAAADGAGLGGAGLCRRHEPQARRAPVATDARGLVRLLLDSGAVGDGVVERRRCGGVVWPRHPLSIQRPSVRPFAAPERCLGGGMLAVAAVQDLVERDQAFRVALLGFETRPALWQPWLAFDGGRIDGGQVDAGRVDGGFDDGRFECGWIDGLDGQQYVAVDEAREPSAPDPPRDPDVEEHAHKRVDRELVHRVV
mmetsp:Transcript_2190/g.7922  ORF Transcript_2190/g.7922 Transcript_2190/m.7922 type:complete len:261 (+) Transcript_2190:304-1086(+)